MKTNSRTLESVRKYVNEVEKIFLRDIPDAKIVNCFIDEHLMDVDLEMKKEGNRDKQIIFFAGPNGSGKSTAIKIYGDNIKYRYINADNIARVKFNDVEDYFQRNMAAAIYADNARKSCLDNGISFSFETVLSTPRNLEMLKQAKEKGYYIECHYIITRDANINVERVKKRVLEGGHDVPVDKIVERYSRCLLLLPEILEICDKAVVYDNSFKYEVICLKEKGEYYFVKMDDWVNEVIAKAVFKK